MRERIQVTFPDGPRMVDADVNDLVNRCWSDPEGSPFPKRVPQSRDGWRFAETVGPDKHGSYWQAFQESY